MRIIIKIINIFSRVIKKDKKLITIFFRGYSGSNVSPLIERLENSNLKNYKIKVLRVDKKRNSKMAILKDKYHKYKYALKSQLVISTHGFYKLRSDNQLLNLWHGIPIKSMGYMNKMKTDNSEEIKDDYFLSTSNFYNTIMNSCIGLTVEKYCIAGYPRNDYLFNQEGKGNLEKLIKVRPEGNVLLFMPTYRDVSSSESKGQNERENNMFGFTSFDFQKFNSFLERNSLVLLLKLHPNEETLFSEKYKKYSSKNIILIKEEDLEQQKMDFYKILNAVDLLITDYSSIYFDYLLLDRPIIFTPKDLIEYRENRGFLLDPYDFWTPGPKCLDQSTLQDEIKQSLNNKEYYKGERKIIRDIVHEYQDGNSTDRVINLINNIMNK
ncbi:CDP-glycerol glycerophosphotransferase family protein [Halalkalibacter nanhaiisediminis]|uniref:CDP-glycerol glycerophosphotransferase (TagB/SpsB family) n=1 Tax=Halalkalibacter nanhaiisediminis TaxID=688079 RepID=A0A562QUF6_9BACI|nr:CDP-glycerol glycerophosphotransferase family protein [Halalkalibacter nanhaiisediminis]TWI59880.1 CDP-glycerol glycerophosphotransferase (TagB/SpsB family) [Halalkalibacter nanhaiisediminis]